MTRSMNWLLVRLISGFGSTVVASGIAHPFRQRCHWHQSWRLMQCGSRCIEREASFAELLLTHQARTAAGLAQEQQGDKRDGPKGNGHPGQVPVPLLVG